MIGGSLTWAEWTTIAVPRFFVVTGTLHSIEDKLGLNPFSLGTGALHITRRFEYPWCFLNALPFNHSDIVLDVGSGKEVFPIFLSRFVKQVHALDIDEDTVKWLGESSLNSVDLVGATNKILPVCGDATNLPYQDEFFDKVFCVSTLEHILPINQLEIALSELVRVTKPQGKIIITMDVMINKDREDFNFVDLQSIATKYSFAVPPIPPLAILIKVPPYNTPFAIACIALEKNA